MIAILLVLGCTSEEPVVVPPILEGPPELELPSLKGVDLESAFEQALQIALDTNLRGPWQGHVASLAHPKEPGCPDFFTGTPDAEGDDVDPDAMGLSWADHCMVDRETYWRGFAFWENTLFVDDTTVNNEVTYTGSRSLTADGIVGNDKSDEVFFEFDGDGADSLRDSQGGGGNPNWSYSSVLQATVTGSDAFGAKSGTPGGFRADMTLGLSDQGGEKSIRATGNVFFFDHLLEGRFDSMRIVFDYRDQLGACGGKEPAGYISLRDENAYWYDLVLQPGTDDDLTDINFPNQPLDDCDGCGTLYVRGILMEDVEVCPDFSKRLRGIEPPSSDEYVYSMRDLVEESP